MSSILLSFQISVVFLLLNTIIDSIRKYMQFFNPHNNIFFPNKRFFSSIYPSQILLLTLQRK